MCTRSFSVDHRQSVQPLWIPHLDGISIRRLADEHGRGIGTTYRHIITELNALPENTWLTQQYCNRWSGILVVDGKFVKVKGYAKKIPFIYAIDYLTHDIPLGMLFPSENMEAFAKFFKLLRLCQYPLQIVVSDDASGLISGLKRVYPKAQRQLCHNHYLENIRQQLHIRTEKHYQSFFTHVHAVFTHGWHHKKREAQLHHLWYTYARNNDPVLEAIILDIAKRYHELFAYDRIPHCPRTTNIIESYNSHLNGRLKTMKGFQTYRSAERWLNAWMIRRRTKPFTDCSTKFKHLNGKCSLEMSMKKQAQWPVILGVQAPKMER